MQQPSFIRTLTAGTGFSPVHAHFCARGLSLFTGVPPVGNWVKDPHPAPKVQ